MAPMNWHHLDVAHDLYEIGTWQMKIRHSLFQCRCSLGIAFDLTLSNCLCCGLVPYRYAP